MINKARKGRAAIGRKKLKLDLDVFAFGIGRFEIGLCRVAAHARDNGRRENFGLVVKGLDRSVVIFAGVGDVLFKALQLVLQVNKIGVGL